MRFINVVLAFAVGALVGVVLTSVGWNRLSKRNDDAWKARFDNIEKTNVLERYVHDCILAMARKGLTDRDPVRTENCWLLTGAYFTAKFWKEDLGREVDVQYDFLREQTMTVFELEDPDEFSELKDIENASVFVDPVGNINHDRVRLVEEFLAVGWASEPVRSSTK